MGSRAFAAAVLLCLAPEASRADAAVERAIQALRRDPSLKVRAQAALLLGQRGALDAVPALAAALREDRAAPVRIAAAAALGKLDDPLAREALESAGRSDPDVAVRAAAASALADLRTRARRRNELSVEEAHGEGGEGARSALRSALVRHLAQRGFSVVAAGEGAAYRIKPSILSVEVAESGGEVTIAVTTSALAVGEDGRMAAMIRTGTRLKAASRGLSEAAQERLSLQALDAAAKGLAQDLAAQLR
jgi:hypothetical protein